MSIEQFHIKNAVALGEEDGKYKSLKKKNKQKTKHSDHKHNYKNCIYYYPGKAHFTGAATTWFSLGSYCSICGKVKDFIYDDEYYSLTEDRNTFRFFCKSVEMLTEDEKKLISYYKNISADPFKTKYIDV